MILLLGGRDDNRFHTLKLSKSHLPWSLSGAFHTMPVNPQIIHPQSNHKLVVTIIPKWYMNLWHWVSHICRTVDVLDSALPARSRAGSRSAASGACGL
jgi:hypothetical protein